MSEQCTSLGCPNRKPNDSGVPLVGTADVCDCHAKVNGGKYRNCIAWNFIAGSGHACFGMCSEAQRIACGTEQEKDNKEKLEDA